MNSFVATIAVSILAVGSVALSTATPALAYVSQANSIASISPASANPGGQVTFSGTFKDQNGLGIAGATVTFSQQSGPANCQVTFSPTSATTDANGQFTTTVTLPPNCPGPYTLAASAQGITVTASVRESGGFPATTTEAPGTRGGQPSWPIPVLAAGLALIALGGGGWVLRHR